MRSARVLTKSWPVSGSQHGAKGRHEALFSDSHSNLSCGRGESIEASRPHWLQDNAAWSPKENREIQDVSQFAVRHLAALAVVDQLCPGGGVLAGGGGLAAARLRPGRVLGTFPFFAVGCIAAWRQWRAPSAARTSAMQASLQAMPWRALADALEAAWIAQGYQVERLAPGGAADFVLSRGGQIQLASARRWKAAHHGVEPLRELHAMMQKRAVPAGLYLLGQGELSENARLFARDHGLTIVQGDALAQLLLH